MTENKNVKCVLSECCFFSPLNFAAVTRSTHELTCTALPILCVLVPLVTEAAVGTIHVFTEPVAATHRAVRTFIHICKEN